MNKKVIIGIILAIIVVAIIVALVVVNNKNDESSNLTATNEMNVNKNENNLDNDEEEKEIETTSNGDSKILVAYFSVPETDNPNNMTREEENSAIVVNGEVLGNTQYAAMLISEKTGGDIYRIEPKTPYTTDHEKLVDQAKEEQNDNARPEIKDKVENFDDYDVIFVGYPNWWGDMPMILYTFLESYDFSGKTVVPFNTHGGSGLSSTVRTITNKLSNAKVEKNAITISRNNMEQASNEIDKWLKDIGITN